MWLSRGCGAPTYVGGACPTNQFATSARAGVIHHPARRWLDGHASRHAQIYHRRPPLTIEQRFGASQKRRLRPRGLVKRAREIAPACLRTRGPARALPASTSAAPTAGCLRSGEHCGRQGHVKLHAAASSSRSHSSELALANLLRRACFAPTPMASKANAWRHLAKPGPCRLAESVRAASLILGNFILVRHAHSAVGTAPSWCRANAKPAVADRRAVRRAGAARTNVVIPAARALICASPSAQRGAIRQRRLKWTRRPWPSGQKKRKTDNRGARWPSRSFCAGPRRTARQREPTLRSHICKCEILRCLAGSWRARADQQLSTPAQSGRRRTRRKGVLRNRPPPSTATLARLNSVRRRRRAAGCAAPSGHCLLQSRAQAPSSVALPRLVALGAAALGARARRAIRRKGPPPIRHGNQLARRRTQNRGATSHRRIVAAGNASWARKPAAADASVPGAQAERIRPASACSFSDARTLCNCSAIWRTCEPEQSRRAQVPRA